MSRVSIKPMPDGDQVDVRGELPDVELLGMGTDGTLAVTIFRNTTASAKTLHVRTAGNELIGPFVIQRPRCRYNSESRERVRLTIWHGPTDQS